MERYILITFSLLVLANIAWGQELNLKANWGHTGHLTTASLSPDQKLVATGANVHTMNTSAGFNIKLWDLKTGKEVRSFKGASGHIRAIDLRIDNKYLAAAVFGGFNEKLIIWDVETREEIKLEIAVSEDFSSVLFSKDGRYLVAGGENKLFIFDLEERDKSHVIEIDQPYIDDIAFSPDDRRLASEAENNSVAVWNVATGEKIKSFRGHNENIQTITFSRDGRSLAAAGSDNTVKVWDVRSGREIATLRSYMGSIRSIAFSPDGRQLALGSAGYVVSLWDIKTGKEIKILEGHTDEVIKVDYIKDTGMLLSAGKDNTVRIWNPVSGSQNNLLSLTGNVSGIASFNMDENGRYLVAQRSDKSVMVWEVPTGKLLNSFSEYKNVEAVTISPNGKYLAIKNRVDNDESALELKIIEFSTGTVVSKSTEPNSRLAIYKHQVAFSSDSRYLATKVPRSMSRYATVHVWEVGSKNKQPVAKFDTGGFSTLSFSANGQQVFTSDGNSIRRWDISTGELVKTEKTEGKIVGFNPARETVVSSEAKTIRLHDLNSLNVSQILNYNSYTHWAELIAISSGGRYLASGSVNPMDSSIKIWDLIAGRELRTINTDGRQATSLSFTANQKYLVSSDADGAIRFYDVQTGRELFSVYNISHSADWIAVAPDGRFDGTPRGLEMLHYVKGMQIIPLESFFENYYTPNLITRLLSGGNFASLTSLQSTSLPPEVAFVSPDANSSSEKKEVRIQISVTDKGGGVDEVRLYQNGKLVTGTQRGLKLSNKTDTYSFDVSLSTGENQFKAIALNSDRIESIPDFLTVHYAGARATTRLYLLTIGINEYKNPRYSLNYARSDAAGFESRIVEGGQSIYEEVIRLRINDAGATKKNILAALDQIQSQAGTEDMFVFYYAGHGVMSEGITSQSEFFIAPYDVIQLYGNETLLKEKGIAASEIQEYSKRIKAQKQLFVLDACQSGGATEMLAMRGAAEEKAIAQLARSTGTFWLTASGSEQFATEFKTLGHGVFTYSILEGLNGRADQGTKDQKITVQELSAYLNDRVPELTEIHKGQIQYPSSYGYGQDFPIGVIK